MKKKAPQQPQHKPGEIDPIGIWEGIVKGLEVMRQQKIDKMIASGEVDPSAIATMFSEDVDLMLGRTHEQRFSSFVGWLSTGRFPQFKTWWNLMNRHERLRWRMAHNLGGSANPNRIKGAIA